MSSKPWDADIRRQTLHNGAMAAVIAKRHGVSARVVIARTVTLGMDDSGIRYETSSRMSEAAAEAAFVENDPAQQNGLRTALTIGKIALALPLLLLGYCAYSVFQPREQPSVGETSVAYQRCEAKLKPKLSSCLEVQPEENWQACRSAYLSEVGDCTGADTSR